MTVNKITSAPTPNEQINKINELVDGVNNAGTVKKVNNVSPDANGNVTIATGGTVDQTYSASSTNAQSGVAIAGAKFVQNTATGTSALTICGTASNNFGATNIGYLSTVSGEGGVAIGTNSNSSAHSAAAIGGGANATAKSAIQIGYGTNSSESTLSIGFYESEHNYKLLDGTTGLIPDERISSNIARTSAIPTVNNATLTIQKNGTTVKTFTANASSNVTANITVPTQASDINAQATLVSGTNIKTINGNSLLGSGDLTISGGGASRNIGEIVASTIPLTDAGLHLLDGTLISGSGVYSAFVTYIAGLYNSGDYTAIFDTEANWQTSVTNYGVCGKFVYNSTNNTVRLPKYNSKIYTGGGTAPVVGNGGSLGLTNGNISGALGDIYLGSNNYTRQNLQLQVLGTPIGVDNDISRSTQTYSVAAGVVSNPEYSGLIALLSNITSSLDGYYYIVVATSAKTDIQVDIDEIATDLNGKADVDGSNMVSSVKKFDGQWVHSQSVLGTSIAKNTYTVDVSSYLPNDNYQYEVLLNLRAYSSNSSNAGVVFVYSDIFSKTPATTSFEGQGAAGGSSRQIGNTFIIPVGTGRTIYYEVTDYAVSNLSLLAWGYRRIGTNS